MFLVLLVLVIIYCLVDGKFFFFLVVVVVICEIFCVCNVCVFVYCNDGLEISGFLCVDNICFVWYFVKEIVLVYVG